MQLSLLSAFARLNVDPWEESSRLADLPKVAAAKALGAMLKRLPAGEWDRDDCAGIASRLVLKLPLKGGGVTTDVSGVQRDLLPRLVWPAGLLLALLWVYFSWG